MTISQELSDITNRLGRGFPGQGHMIHNDGAFPSCMVIQKMENIKLY